MQFHFVWFYNRLWCGLFSFSLFFLFLWLDSLQFSSSTIWKFAVAATSDVCLLVCVCVSEKSASAINSRWHFLLLLFFVCKILYIGIAFQIKRRYSFDTSMHIKSYPIKLKNSLLIPTQRRIHHMNSSSLIFVWNNEEVNTNDNQKTNTNTLYRKMSRIDST